MPSYLTRRVVRSLIANEPIVHRGCLRRRAYSTLTTTSASASSRHSSGQHVALTAPPTSQRRTFFNNFSPFGKTRQETLEANTDPGIDKLMELSKKKRMQARLPSPSEIGKAFTRFFDHRQKVKKGIEDTHAQLAVEALRHIAASDGEQDGHLSQLRVIVTPGKSVFTALLRTSEPTDTHVQLAQMLYDALKSSKLTDMRVSAARTYIWVLGRAAHGLEARQVMEDLEKGEDSWKLDKTTHPHEDTEEQEISVEEQVESEAPDRGTITRSQRRKLWSAVFRATALANDETKLLEILEIMRDRGYLPLAAVADAMVRFYVRRDNLDNVQSWYQEAWRLHTSTSRHTDTMVKEVTELFRLVLQWCLSTEHVEFGHEVIRLATMRNPPKIMWDAIFVWAAGTGKGADEIGRMFNVMENSNRSTSDRDQSRVPDIATINGLVEFATSRNDPYLAERFIALGHQRGISPDSRTYVLQMEYRLKVNDVDGALIAYTNLQAMDLSDNGDVPAVNKLIVALCNSRRHDFDTIMNVTADLSDRRARFEAPAVSSLALLHLRRDEFHDVADLLSTHASQYSSSERAEIRRAILAFALDAKTPLSRSWDAYNILRSIFDEMPRPQRTEIMAHFFRQERPDLAVHVFTGMRRHSRDDTIPTIDTYATAFLECAKIRDIESLEVIHNQLKLDYNVNVDTYLYNTLIIGYTACGKPRRAMDFWDDIVSSKEGPTYNTIHIAFRACEKSPFGDLKAQEIWQKLRRQKVDIDQAMWASYVAALAGNGDNELAISTLEEAEAKNEVEIDAFLLGSLLTGAPGQEKQAEITGWAKERYPHAWEALEKIGFDVDEAGMKIAKIDRSVTP
ncbi:Hypothetical predicted protein [Lecanosticta acicola]|uniref:Complex I intermediate-associated protein 84, mitochondrial n=1 Tax=Lecanosticta acicola TaxID=111012 RepID=A0AAI9EAB5_9PEZI|nr:Hypothetical predicted protein [Lecanosticta acicola]